MYKRKKKIFDYKIDKVSSIIVVEKSDNDTYAG